MQSCRRNFARRCPRTRILLTSGRGQLFERLRRGEPAGIQVPGSVDSLDFCRFSDGLSRGLGGRRDFGTNRPVTAYLASSPFLPSLSHFAQ